MDSNVQKAAPFKLWHTLLMLIMPAVIASILGNLQEKVPVWSRTIFTWIQSTILGRVFTRTLEHKIKYNRWGYQMSERSADHRNQILQKAITLKIASDKAAIKFHDAKVALTQVESNKQTNCYDSDSDDEESVAKQLKAMDVSTLPPQDQWVQVTPSLEAMFSKNEVKSGGGEATDKSAIITHTHTFRSTAADAEKEVSNYVDEAYQWYIERLKAKEDTGRYMYNPIPKSEGHWKRYKLSDEKTFDSLFFPQKERLFGILEQFQNKSGKFAIEGYPHKLGLLLHGPPGTGKTSLIKALANYTGRSIVNIPLSRIKTNQALMNYVFDQSFNVPGLENSPVSLEYKDTIFVMEDVDAAGTVVHKREMGEQTDALLLKDSLKRPAQDGLGRSQSDCTAPALTRTGSNKMPVGGSNAEKEDKEEISEAGVNPDVTAPVLGRTNSKIGEMATLLEDDTSATTQGASEEEAAASEEEAAAPEEEAAAPEENGDEDEGGKGGKGASKKGKGGRGASTGASQSNDDKLDLAGLLNVLDGVVDCPNRMVVMTTNHPEKLDPAVIRPGRVNLKVYLGYIGLPEAIQMIEHYFGGFQGKTLTEEERDSITEAWTLMNKEVPVSLTPAQVEQLCAENGTVVGLCAVFEEMGRAFHEQLELSRTASNKSQSS